MNTHTPAQLPLDLKSEPSHERDDLVVGPSNALAVAAVDSWPAWPHPVMLIVGPPGSGKTHLARIWARHAQARALAPEACEPVGGADFAVLAEDIDRAGFDESVLFAQLNAARLGDGFVLATARSRPDETGVRMPDLLSRLRAATVLELAAPDEGLVAAVLVKLSADRQIALDPRLASYAAMRMERSLAAAADMVERLDFAALAARERFTRSLVRRILLDMAADGGGRHERVVRAD